MVKTLAWYGLATNTRYGYKTAIDLYEAFCALNNWVAWPASQPTLEERSATRIYGSTTPKLGRIKADTLQRYLSGLRSYHVDHNLPTQVFESPRLAWILNSGRRLFPSPKAKRLPITKEILEFITVTPLVSVEDLNIDTAFKMAWAGFLRLGEITYTAADLRKSSFPMTHVTRLDDAFTEYDQYAVLRLKNSKTDLDHISIQIILAATSEASCPVKTLRRLLKEDPQPGNAPLFRMGPSFSRPAVISI